MSEEVGVARFVIATRRYGTPEARLRACDAMDTAIGHLLRPGATVIGQHRRESTHSSFVLVAEMSEEEMARIRSLWPSEVLVERAVSYAPAPTARVEVLGDDGALSFARVIGFVTDKQGNLVERLSTITGYDGVAELTWAAEAGRLDTVIVRPWGEYWSRVEPIQDSASRIECARLPKGPGGWWHDVLGVDPRRRLGAGIKVGVIDTGVGPHPCLEAVADLGTFENGNREPHSGDAHGHGTHVAGLIGACPRDDRFGGVAHGVTLAAASIFGEAMNPSQADLANAVDAMSLEFEADLINLSLAGQDGSDIAREAIEQAFELGALCIGAAGNTGEQVQFPAAYAAVVAVGAFGRTSWGAPQSLCTLQRLKDAPGLQTEEYFVAKFSCHGDELFCSAPGVGIISTIPSRDGAQHLFTEMDGTSMASPLVCGTLAALLSEDAGYRALPRGRARAELARTILAASCRPLGLSPRYSGRGCPTYGPAHVGTGLA